MPDSLRVNPSDGAAIFLDHVPEMRHVIRRTRVV